MRPVALGSNPPSLRTVLGRGRPVLMTDLPHSFRRPDGVELAWREAGSGRPFVLLHGLMGSGSSLAGQGLVPALAEGGYRVILPDLRGHGDSGRPHDSACYPPDILADDMLALIGYLGLDDYDLGGYSMGGKLVLRLLARGARPVHAVVGGQGLDALDAESARTNGHRRILAAVAGEPPCPPGQPRKQQRTGSGRAGLTREPSGSYSAASWRRLPTPCDRLRCRRWSSSVTRTAVARRRARSQLCCLAGSSSWCPATTSQLRAPRSSQRRFSSSSEIVAGRRIALADEGQR